MPSPSERQRNNVRAGAFVSIAIILAVASVVMLTDVIGRLRHPRREYTITFDVSEGVKNLKAGADVRIGGVLMGRVERVEPRLDGTGPLEQIDVTMAIDNRVRLFKDAKIVITPAVIGADAWIDVTSVGSRETLAPGETLSGYSGPGIVTALLGAGNAEKADEIVENIRAATGSARSLVNRVNEDDWPRWSGKVDSILDWGNQAVDKFDKTMADARAGVGDIRAMITDNRPKIDNIINNVDTSGANIADITTHFREQTVAKVDQLLDRGREGLDSAVAVIDRLSKDYDTWAPDVRETLADFRLTAQQIKLAGIEIRRSPWKLLYRPSNTELDHEFLYEATRSFALATSDLKSAVESVQRLLANHGDEIARDPQLQALMVKMLERPTTDFDKARQRLLDVLVME